MRIYVYTVSTSCWFLLKKTFSRVLELEYWFILRYTSTKAFHNTKRQPVCITHSLRVTRSRSPTLRGFARISARTPTLTTLNNMHNRVNENWNQWNAITAREKQINTSHPVWHVCKAFEQGDLWHGGWIRAASNRWPVESTVHLLAIEKWAQLPSSCQ